MITSCTLSAAQQHNLISSINIAVRCIAKRLSTKTGRKNFFREEELEDISGEVAYRACRSLNTYDCELSKFTTWVSHIALNCVKDALDYKMKRLGISLSSYSENSDNGDELNYTEVTDKHAGFCPELYSRMCEYNPETLICRKEVKDEIYRQIDMLSEKNQRFARLLLDECQPKTMAKLEGCTANAAAKRIFDIRKVLKAGLSEFAN